MGKHIMCYSDDGSFIEVVDNSTYITIWIWDEGSMSHRQIRLTTEDAMIFRKEVKKAVKKVKINKENK